MMRRLTEGWDAVAFQDTLLDADERRAGLGALRRAARAPTRPPASTCKPCARRSATRSPQFAAKQDRPDRDVHVDDAATRSRSCRAARSNLDDPARDADAPDGADNRDHDRAIRPASPADQIATPRPRGRDLVTAIDGGRTSDPPDRAIVTLDQDRVRGGVRRTRSRGKTLGGARPCRATPAGERCRRRARSQAASDAQAFASALGAFQAIDSGIADPSRRRRSVPAPTCPATC